MKTLYYLSIRPLEKLWRNYKLLVEKAIRGNAPFNGVRDITFWQERLFTNTVLYGMPISLVALIPSVIITLYHGYHLIPVIDVLALVANVFITLNRRLNIIFRKVFVVVSLYLLAITLIASLGSFGIGSIYVLALSAFIALLFRTRVSYWTIVVNFFIYLAFALVIQFKLFNSPLIANYTVSFWIGYSLNLLFLNLMVVMQIRHVINGLEGTIIKETVLLKELQTEVAEKIHRNERLKESKEHYKSLFFLNPSPMWIFDNDTLQFLQVNEAAINKYGYSEQEFLSMTIKSIRPAENIAELTEVLRETAGSNSSLQRVIKHQCKDGQQFYAEVRCSTIPFKGKEARLVIARNITAQIEHNKAIEKQNAKLREIAYMQSHIVRAPLARVIALTDLIKEEVSSNADVTLLNYLDTSVKELDDVVKAIVDNTEELVPAVSYDRIIE